MGGQADAGSTKELAAGGTAGAGEGGAEAFAQAAASFRLAVKLFEQSGACVDMQVFGGDLSLGDFLEQKREVDDATGGEIEMGTLIDDARGNLAQDERGVRAGGGVAGVGTATADNGDGEGRRGGEVGNQLAFAFRAELAADYHRECHNERL